MTASDPALPHRAIVGLAIAQIVGWGTSYYVPSVLAPEFRDSLGLSQEAVFGGITIMLLVGAAAAPATSRLIERRGARAALILGSALLAVALSGIVSAGLGPLMVLILSAFGLPDATAVGISALVGPAAVAARICEVVLGPRVGIMAVALAATTPMTVAIGLPLVAGTSAFIAVLFVVGYAMSAGTMTVVRAVMPLTLFGRERYARLLGRLAVPQNAVLAVSPMVLASVISRTGPDAVLWIALAAAILSLGAITGLAILLNRPEVDRAP